MNIFVSYSTRDGLVDERKLTKFLEVLPSECSTFVDLLHNDSKNIQARIENEIRCCDLVIGLTSPAFFESPWVKLELDQAQKNDKRVLLFNAMKLFGVNTKFASMMPTSQPTNTYQAISEILQNV